MHIQVYGFEYDLGGLANAQPQPDDGERQQQPHTTDGGDFSGDMANAQPQPGDGQQQQQPHTTDGGRWSW